MCAVDKANLQAIDLSSVGITRWSALYRNLSYDELYEHETDPTLDGLERCYSTRFGALSVDTGKFTGRSPQDKYVVDEETSRDHVWWAGPENPGSNNRRMSEATWAHLKALAAEVGSLPGSHADRLALRVGEIVDNVLRC